MASAQPNLGNLGSQLPSPTRRAIFGPLAASDPSGAVVRRLRAAIGLGLLADGDRLPREADLASELGITTFSLREALGELRREGLLVTKAGKYGGSFVTRPTETNNMEREELLALTSTELRDLGDWRQMLASHSAALAALRATEFNLERLRAYAAQVGEVTSGAQARGAHGRFHVELASAGQSLRMTKSEFAVHEELDWLFSLALATKEQRHASADLLREVTDAVARHDGVAATSACERYTSLLVGELARLRLEGLAERHQQEAPHPGATLDRELKRFATSLLDELTAIALEVAPALGQAVEELALRRQVTTAILARIGSFPRFADEVSVLAEVGVVPQHRYWTEAWHRTDAGPRHDDSHVMDPNREDFYDYESREFIAQPRETRRAWATGPYVDYGGADEYIVTISVPITFDDRFLGIVASDFLVADLERLLSPWLATPERTVLLVNADQRVIVSNSFLHQAGDVVSIRKDFEQKTFPLFGWRLLTRASARGTF